MSLITRIRRQTLVWWQAQGTNKFGKALFLPPVELTCRWEGGGKEYLNKQGQLTVPTATIYVPLAFSIGDRVMQGELESTTPDDPLTLADAYEVKNVSSIPNLRNTEILHIVKV